MFLEIFAMVLIGVLFGIFTGLAPGIHVNLVALTVLALFPTLSSYGLPTEAIISFIISLGITHTFLDFLPGIFLGAPEDDTALSILPGHRLLLEGRGLEAVYLTVIGGVGVVLIAVLMMPLLLKVLPFIYNSIKLYIHWLLIAIVTVMIFTEKKMKKLWALLVFALSGLLGVIVLNSMIIQPVQVFFPLFTGLFGISTLLISLKARTKIPKQDKTFGSVSKSLAISGIVKGFFSGLIVGLLPGVGSAQAGTLVQQITRKENTREFLISLGGINTANALFALLALYTIGRPRSGAAVVVGKIVGTFTFSHMLLLVATALIATGIAAVLTLKISKTFLHLVEKVPYEKLSKAVIAFLVLLTFVFTGFTGLLVLVVSTAIGLMTALSGVKRSLCMGVLILNVILFYAGIQLI